ncbi:hypothetical protein EHM69_03535 [candidate division KSB1 bacterium]|nr:MAG: hypothetical protein EHM69_03535 [candidate division KSB1 bacterium]
MPDDCIPRKVRALINPRSGPYFYRREVLNYLHAEWDRDGIEFDHQESENPSDGKAKALQAAADGVDTLLVCGGDGIVNTVGAELIGSDIALGVIPLGSGNGFARHFGIPMHPRQACRSLKNGVRKRIDVGIASGRPFFVTCGLAWEAELVKGYEQMLIRGTFSYVFSGLLRFFMFKPQDHHLIVDGEHEDIRRPLLLTIANLTQYGGGARIAPRARHDDGVLKLIAIQHQDALKQLPQIYRLFDGTIESMSGIRTWDFRTLVVERERAEAIQVDGELHEVEKDFMVEVLPQSLEVIVPSSVPQHRRFWPLATGINHK